MQREDAVSELVSALLLAVVIVAGAAVFLVALTSQYPPVIMPDSSVEVWNEGKTIFVQSTGGDPLPMGSYNITVISKSSAPEYPLSNYSNISNTLGNYNLSTGNTIYFNTSISPLADAHVQVIYQKGGTSLLMYDKKLG